MDIINKLQKKVEEYWGNIIIGLVILAMIALVAGGWVFYCHRFPDNFWFCLGMTLQNCMETLLFNPVLTIQDIVEEKDFINSLHGYKYAFIVAYKIAMVAVPFLEVLAAFCFLDRFLHIFVGFTLKKKRILIVGYNDRVCKLLKRGVSDAKIYLWVDDMLSEEEERDLYLKNVMVKKGDFSIIGSREMQGRMLDKFDKFLRENRITHVLLLNESDFHNMEYYMALSSCKACKEDIIHFFVLIKDYKMGCMLEDYFDRKLENVKKSSQNTRMDLRIFNFQQIQAEKLFNKMPLFVDKNYVDKCEINQNNQNKQIHLLLVGEGLLCEQIALHAMNQGVVTSENDVLIDIISEDAKETEKRLANRFNHEYVIHSSDGKFLILSPESDGKLIISLHSCSFEGDSFIEQVVENSSSAKFTYMVFCLPEPERNLYCMLQIEKSGKDILAQEKIPVAVRIKDTKENMRLLQSFKFIYVSENYWSEKIKTEEEKPQENKPGEIVYLMGEDEEKTGIEEIISKKEERDIREYHRNYAAVSSKFKNEKNSENQSDKHSSPENEMADSEDAILDELWNREVYYKRESNRALFFHQKNKDYYKKDLAKKEDYELEVENFIKNAGINSLTAQEWSTRLLAEEKGKVRFPILLEMAKTEHRRFNYFFASMGWGYNDKKIEKEKLHDCLCEWNRLVEKRQDALIYDLVSNNDIFMEKQQQQK